MDNSQQRNGIIFGRRKKYECIYIVVMIHGRKLRKIATKVHKDDDDQFDGNCDNIAI